MLKVHITLFDSFLTVNQAVPTVDNILPEVYGDVRQDKAGVEGFQVDDPADITDEQEVIVGHSAPFKVCKLQNEVCTLLL